MVENSLGRYNLLILCILIGSGLIFFSSCHKKEIIKTINISGAFALYPLTINWAERYHSLHPEVVINVSAGGAGKGITDVLSGMVDIAMLSREISPSEVKKGSWSLTVAKDAVIPTMNSANPFKERILRQGIRPASFREIFISRSLTYWEQLVNLSGKSKINIYTRSDASGAGETWAKFLGTEQENIAGVGVFGDPGMADAIISDKSGIGYNNIVYTYDLKTRLPYKGLLAVPIDMNGNGLLDNDEKFYSSLDSVIQAINDGRYPTPPARELFLVTKGKPRQEAVVNFLQWILTEGQKYVKEAGYVNLPVSGIEKEKMKLN